MPNTIDIDVNPAREMLMSKLKTLTNKRSYAKRTITICSEYLTKEKTTKNIETIARQFSTVEKAIKAHEDYLEEIYIADFDDQFDVHFIEKMVIDELFSTIKDAFLKLNIESSSRGPNVERTSSSSYIANSGVKLPPLSLPTFSGRFEDWISYYASFTRIIGDNSSLSNIDKLQYLRGSLRNEALDVVKSLEINENNFENAIQLLKDRFDNKRLVINTHVKALFELEPVTKETLHGIRKLLDTSLQHIRSLSSLNRPVDEWDDLLIYLIISKLPFFTRKEWENKIELNEIPTFKQLTDFLVLKCHMLTALQSKDFEARNNNNKSFKERLTDGSITCHLNNVNPNKFCHCCSSNEHFLSQCETFLKLSQPERYNLVTSKRLCLNCLRKGHSCNNCRSSRCQKCNKSHNTTLHRDSESDSKPTSSSLINIADEGQNVEATVNTAALQSKKVIIPNILLCTCLVNVEDINGKFHLARILLDSGSQVHIITRKLQEKLGLKTNNMNMSIIGISEKCTTSNKITQVLFKSRTTEFFRRSNAIVLDRICSKLPMHSISNTLIKIPENLILADPEFNLSREIDMLVGAEHFFDIIDFGKLLTNVPGVILQKSHLGWLVSGSISQTLNVKSLCSLTKIDDTLINIEKTIEKFWEIEHFPPKKFYTEEERQCENHFQATITRNSEGRFIARLPWKESPERLGNSLDLSLKRLYCLERKLAKDENARKEYNKFMSEYLSLGHMKLKGKLSDIDKNELAYYLPHHAVYKEDSLTTKVRVVFNASAKTTNNVSLNELLMKGPQLQDELFSILIRFRFYKYVIIADIGKMYRQILINKLDTKFQRILFRFSIDDDIDVYELETLTYGTRPASFIAICCLMYIASKIKKPKLAKMIKEDFYVDDFISGGDNIEELRELISQLCQIFNSYGFNLLKWCSNNTEILKDLDTRNEEHLVIPCDMESKIKTLGVSWIPASDTIIYNHETLETEPRVTKRSILKNISQIFDPLGLVGPIIVTAKIIMQDVWALKISWDATVPQEICTRWLAFCVDLKNLNKLSINRNIKLHMNSIIEFHVFADASEKSYGCCIYVREKSENNINCNLLCSKSRVAPLKRLSMPRLELCAALLAIRLVDKVKSSCNFEIQHIYYYSDSTITLCWINECPSRLNTFVANRVSEIQSKSSIDQWCHVVGEENPADIISRGAKVSELLQKDIWWLGTAFLHDPCYIPKKYEVQRVSNIPEVKILLTQANCVLDKDFCNNLISRYSRFLKLVRVTAYCKRFIRNCQNSGNKLFEPLSVDEISSAETRLIQMVQKIHFLKELKSLKDSNAVDSNSSLLSLSPFLDDQQLIRVGGRLRNANMESKHQVILPRSSIFTDLIIQFEHERSLHAGLHGTLAQIRLKYWIISARHAIRKIIRKCVICFRCHPTFNQPIMADLPASRLTVTRPFTRAGVDFFGPLHLKEGLGRSKRIIKGYGCIFVCLVTKAVHCELVESLSTEAFLAALNRFVSRRGLVEEICCDNATNFIGARNELNEVSEILNNPQTKSKICEKMSILKIKFRFSPPRAPHFNGLAEAAVKSFKRHMVKIVGNAHLTFIEMYTLLAEIESILNSRPLTPISSDPNDFDFITPGHFIIGENMREVPELNLSDLQDNQLSRWQRVQKLKQNFWKRWQNEYIQELQSRTKWRLSKGEKVKIGQMVLLQEENVPSLRWKVGRITDVHPGSDGVIRVVTVRTQIGETTRPVIRLCILPS